MVSCGYVPLECIDVKRTKFYLTHLKGCVFVYCKTKAIAFELSNNSAINKGNVTYTKLADLRRPHLNTTQNISSYG